MKIKIAVLEDEFAEAQVTCAYLQRFAAEEGKIFEIDCYSKADELLSALSKGKLYHLLLLDIILPDELNGMDVARKIRETNSDIAMMFITKTVQYAINGYEVDAVDYLLKPLSYHDFILKMKKAMRYVLLHIDKPIILHHKEGITRVYESQIYYIEVIKHYLIIHTTIGTFTMRGSMCEMETRLSKCFSRSGNSYLVNLRYVDELRSNEVIVHGERIPFTRLRKNEFIKAFNAYTGAI